MGMLLQCQFYSVPPGGPGGSEATFHGHVGELNAFNFATQSMVYRLPAQTLPESFADVQNHRAHADHLNEALPVGGGVAGFTALFLDHTGTKFLKVTINY